MITQDELKKLLHYNPETGIFTWLVSKSNCVKVGARAGSVCMKHRLNASRGMRTTNTAYRRIGINNKQRFEHSLAFLYMTGKVPDAVDHINHEGTDNRWCNLRPANHDVNSKNRGLQKRNRSGIHGISILRDGKYQVYIGKRYLYYGDDFFEACCRRKSAEIAHGYHPLHGK